MANQDPSDKRWKQYADDMEKSWDKTRGEIKVIQATKARQEKDTTSGQRSLFPAEEASGLRNDPNKDAMERIAKEKDDAKEKAKEKKAADDYFKDNRTKSSPLIANAELEKMKETLNMPKSGGGGGGGGIPKVGPKKPLDMKKGGKVSSASSRADGCAIRGKTRA